MVKEWDADSQVFNSVVFLEIKEIHLGSIWYYLICIILFTPELFCFCTAHTSTSTSPILKTCSDSTTVMFI